MREFNGVSDMPNHGVVTAAVVMGLKTSAALQLLGTGLAARMKPEFQDLALEFREKGFPRVLDTTNPALAQLDLLDRLKLIGRAGAAVVDRSPNGSGDYVYEVPSGQIRLPKAIESVFNETASKLVIGQERYTKALVHHEKMKNALVGGGAVTVEVLREYSKAALALHSVRTGYHQGVRKYLADRSSLAARNFDVSVGEELVRANTSLNLFLRDCQLLLVRKPELSDPSRKVSQPERSPGLGGL